MLISATLMGGMSTADGVVLQFVRWHTGRREPTGVFETTSTLSLIHI